MTLEENNINILTKVCISPHILCEVSCGDHDCKENPSCLIRRAEEFANKWNPALFGRIPGKPLESPFLPDWCQLESILLFERVGNMMKRFCCWILILCMVCSFSAAMAEDEWTCENCGSEALGNFCSNCGAAKPEGEMWQCPVCGEYATGSSCANCEANGLNGDMLTYYYARSVYQDLDIPYLTNFMRWRDGAEETSALAVFVRDPGSDEVGMFTDAGIVSDEPFPEKRTRKHVKKRG